MARVRQRILRDHRSPRLTTQTASHSGNALTCSSSRSKTHNAQFCRRFKYPWRPVADISSSAILYPPRPLWARLWCRGIECTLKCDACNSRQTVGRPRRLLESLGRQHYVRAQSATHPVRRHSPSYLHPRALARCTRATVRLDSKHRLGAQYDDHTDEYTPANTVGRPPRSQCARLSLLACQEQVCKVHLESNHCHKPAGCCTHLLWVTPHISSGIRIQYTTVLRYERTHKHLRLDGRSRQQERAIAVCG
jgi:hypothetical protein